MFFILILLRMDVFIKISNSTKHNETKAQHVKVALFKTSSIFLSRVLMAVATCVLNVLKFSNERAVCVALVPNTTPVVLVNEIPLGAKGSQKKLF